MAGEKNHAESLWLDTEGRTFKTYPYRHALRYLDRQMATALLRLAFRAILRCLQ